MTLTKIFNQDDFDVYPEYKKNSHAIEGRLESIIEDKNMLEIFKQVTIFNNTANLKEK